MSTVGPSWTDGPIAKNGPHPREIFLKRDELFVGAILFLFGVLTALLSLRMPLGTFRIPGTGMFPFILGILLMLLSGLFLLKLLYRGRGRGEVSPGGGFSLRRQLILFFGAMVLATAFFNPLGYPLVSFLLMIVLLRTLGMSIGVSSILLSLVTAAASYFLFVRWLQIPLPKGFLGL